MIKVGEALLSDLEMLFLIVDQTELPYMVQTMNAQIDAQKPANDLIGRMNRAS